MKIINVFTGNEFIEATLEDGTKISLSMNDDYIHVHFSGINCEKPIEVFDKAANQCNIRYVPQCDIS